MADIKKMREDQALFAVAVLRLREFMEKAMPFNMTVYSYSNLTMDAKLRQDGFAPGDAVHLRAKLWEYQVPLHRPALVWADVLQPDGSRENLPFSALDDGAYTADWITSQPGVYQFVIRAEGQNHRQRPVLAGKDPDRRGMDGRRSAIRPPDGHGRGILRIDPVPAGPGC